MRLKLGLGIALGLFCLWYAFRGISVQDLWTTFRSAQPGWLLVAAATYLTGYALRVVRWQILLRPIRPLPVTSLASPLILGFFANNVLPFRMGELVRAHITGRKFGISRTASLGTILLERLYDTMSFLATFVASTNFFDFPHWVERGAMALGLTCGGIILVLIVLLRHGEWLKSFALKTALPEKWKSHLVNTADNFSEGISAMTHIPSVIPSILLSLVIWILEGTVLYLIAHAFGLALPYPASFFLLFFMGLAVTLPQAPGYVGTLEAFGVTALTTLHFAKEHALPVILAIHGFQFAFILLLGTWALSRERLSLTKLMKLESIGD